MTNTHNKPHRNSRLTARLLHHFMSGKAAARKAFPSGTLKEIQNTIAAGEKTHRAELRVIVEASLSLGAVMRYETSRQRAHELFSHYRIWDTEENCGVLVYINLADHKVEIITDRGVGPCLTREQWQDACAIMTRGFAQGRYHDSVLEALRTLNDWLAQKLPADRSKPGHNEISNRPLVL
jgi:uncharacterized membrane protein